MKISIFAYDKGEFFSELKDTDIVPIQKKKDNSDKSNYRPVGMLSNYSKVYGKLTYNEIYQYFEKYTVSTPMWVSSTQ